MRPFDNEAIDFGGPVCVAMLRVHSNYVSFPNLQTTPRIRDVKSNSAVEYAGISTTVTWRLSSSQDHQARHDAEALKHRPEGQYKRYIKQTKLIEERLWIAVGARGENAISCASFWSVDSATFKCEPQQQAMRENVQ